MAVDPYSSCPCGSGKKLKFCCSDLAADFDKIFKFISSDQPHAALKHVEQLLAKDPNRTSLVDIRLMLELALHELDAAEKTLDHFLKLEPENPSAHAQAAVLASARGLTSEAIAKLQDALERSTDLLSQRVFEAIGSVGHALLLDGDIVAARAHLLLYAGIAPEGENRALELLLRLNVQGGLPQLLRDTLLLLDPPTQFAESNKAAFEEANRLGRRGMWRRAAGEFEKLLNEANPQPRVVYNLALMRGWLGDRERFVEGMHQFARLNVPLDDAVEAEALAQLVDPHLDEPKLESVRLTFPLHGDDLAAERLASDKRIERYELDPETLEEEEVTRPRSTHLLLDRPVPPSGAELTLDQAPNVMAFVSLYGKRTDREARVEVTTDRGEHFEEVTTLIKAILGDAIAGEQQVETVDERSQSEEALSWRWRLPNDTPQALRRSLLSQRRRQAILQDWTAAPRAALAGLSPREAAGRPEMKIPVLASILNVEQSAVDPEELELFQQLRQELGLPTAETIDPGAVDLERLPASRMLRLDLTHVPLSQLMSLFSRAAMTGAANATLRLAQEIVTRDAQDVDLAPVYRHLVRSESDPDRALHWTASAKNWSERAKKPAGEWAVFELEIQIERGDPMGVQNALSEIREKHLQEPGIADGTYRLLYSSGLLTPREPASHPPAVAPPAPAGRLWTPGQGAPADSGGGKSAIWTPG